MKLLKVGEAVRKGVSSCQMECTIEEVAMLMTEEDTRSVVIENKTGKPIGIVTGGDIVKAIARKLNPKTKVEEILSKELITVDADADIVDAATTMNAKKVKRLGVMDKGKLIGIITVNDVLKYSPKYLHEFSRTLEKLDTIIKKL